jgi:hypothetical protein
VLFIGFISILTSIIKCAQIILRARLRFLKSFLYLYIKFLRKKTDAYFFDPPWGGPDYKLKESISIKLSNKSLYEIVKIIRKYNNGLIFFKLPFNYNMSEFNEFNYNVNKIRNYLLVSIF